MSDWLSQEPGLTAGRRQVARLLRRAWRRPASVLLTASFAALLVVGGVLVKEQQFSPRYVLRVEENDRGSGVAPRAKRRLREHVLDAVFSNGRLLKVMEEHGLYQSLRRDNPRAALESFREDIKVDVYRNYFIEDPTGRGPPRSARIAIRYRSSDKEEAVEVARALGRLVVEHERETRQRQATLAAEYAAEHVAAAQRVLNERKDLIAAKERRYAEEPSPARRIELINLSHSLDGLELELERARRRKAAFDMGKAMEQEGLGLHFHTVDSGAVTQRAGIDSEELAVLGVLSGLFAFPLAALGVGAFSTGIDSRDDVEWLGLRVLGHLESPNLRARGYR